MTVSRQPGPAAGSLRTTYYRITAAERELGTFTAKQLALGTNIASSTGSAWQPGDPWDTQAIVLKSLTEARDKITLASSLGNAYFGDSPFASVLNQQQEEAVAQLEAMQRTVARPWHIASSSNAFRNQKKRRQCQRQNENVT